MHSPEPHGASPRDRLRAHLAAVAHLLPIQGPIGVFIHHNTLHAFQGLPFPRALREATRVLGGQTTLSEAAFLAEFARGRIRPDALEAELADELAERGGDRPLAPGVGSGALWRALLLEPLELADGPALEWLLVEEGRARRLLGPAPARARTLAESRRWLEELLARPLEAGGWEALSGTGDAREARARLRRWLRRDPEPEALRRWLWEEPEALAAVTLWSAASRRLRGRGPGRATPPPAWHGLRLRDRLLARGAEDLDDLVHPLLIRWCAAFLDQGLAFWPMPAREEGLLHAVRTLLDQPGSALEPFLRALPALLAGLSARGAGPEEVVLEELARLGLAPEQEPEFLQATLLALPGWAGMIRQLEERPELGRLGGVPARLLDFLALRLLLERCAAEWLAREARLGPEALAPLPGAPASAPGEAARAFQLFQLAQRTGLAAPELLAWSEEELERVLTALDDCDEASRRWVWQRAYERSYRDAVGRALLVHRPAVLATPPRPAPDAALLFCIDDREESLRRHLEELSPRVETYGVAGFFGLAIQYVGLDDPDPSARCPVVLRPDHVVVERPVASEAHLEARFRSRRRFLSAALQGLWSGSRSLLRDLLATLGMGLLAAIPLALRVLGPRQAARLSRRLRALLVPELHTELTALRDLPEPSAPGGLPLGYTAEEAAERVARVLQDAGLRAPWPPLVVAIGHGSSSLNNPHASAYECGACGGFRGGPNARLLATLANDPRVRAALRPLGHDLPEGTWFLGALHDTCTSAVTCFDLERVPAPLRARVEALRELLHRARLLSAHERCRRFEAAPLGLDPEEALRHVEARAEHLAEPRPELGHATNALCLVGRRRWTRGLFLDRRAFLVSYDPEPDPGGEHLARLLSAIVPVCGGINLEYYFSRVDNERFGCGTKLPHNITGLLGVVNGHLSDLRTGLPWQMVEVHEPLRLLLVVEAGAEALLTAVERTPLVREMVGNEWVQLVRQDPADGRLERFEAGALRAWEPPRLPVPAVPRSLDHYRGRRDHLPPASVRAALEAQP